MGMVKMKHINIYGPEQDPQQTLEVLAKLACFHPDKDAERINAAAGAAENLYTPLLASTLGLIKDVGGDPALQEYRGRFFEYGAVKDEVTDVEELACALLELLRDRYTHTLEERYKLPAQDALPGWELLERAAKKRGMLVSGGEADSERMARVLLDEFRGGKLGRFTLEAPEEL